MQRFFAEEIQHQEAFLDAEESKHLVKVLRLKANDQVELFDGNGKLYLAEISQANPKKCTLHILEELEAVSKDFGIHLAVAPTKNLSRWELFLEKATEIGIDRITPLLCDHSERKVLKRDRQLRILKSAVKQSQKLMLPQLDEMISFKELIKNSKSEAKYIAHCEESESKKRLFSIHPKNKNALILIGPEGDFSPEEIKFAEQNGFQSISISESRLRTETAALVALHTLHLSNA
tara:strand:+ start:2833 stop:3534 length:702 start_codon:yes stop_codon:yes gene_type:complete